MLIIIIIFVIIMAEIKFYDREAELETLASVSEPFLAIIYGRRRVGKTRLILEFCRNRGFIYLFVNPEKSSKMLLEEFSSQLRESMRLPSYVRPGSWREFFELLSEYDGIVVFDEFQWFTRVDSSVPFELQRFWDTRQRKPSVIICGSIVGLIKSLFESYQSPLYGRADIRLEVKPLEVVTVINWLNDLGVSSLEEQVRFYLVFGGVPYYYALMSKYSVKSLKEALRKLVFEEHAPLRNEVNSVLREAFGKDYYTYASILSAIAEGYCRVSEIASKVGLKTTSLSPYLKDLVELLDIIEPELPAGRKKGAFYIINDYFTRFWFKYVYKNRSLLEYNWRKAYEKCLQTLDTYLGEAFELLAKEIVVKLAKENKLPLTPTSIAKYYGKSPQGSFDIDIVAYDSKARTALYIEVKWSEMDYNRALNIIHTLAEKSVFTKIRPLKKYYGIIAKKIYNKDKLREEEKIVALDISDLKSPPSFKNI
ncbi:MAG: ATP-binding protein [Thermoprotei archaeon]|nr:MAG: ATP-binding protein [Thermoprotei archaeon]RLE97513.1 MAG: ATP-binding protein [Thermoprotei archaeon]